MSRGRGRHPYIYLFSCMYVPRSQMHISYKMSKKNNIKHIYIYYLGMYV